MRVLLASLALLLVCLMSAQAMSYEVDALYAEEAYEPYFIEVNTLDREEPSSMEIQSFIEAEETAQAVPEMEEEAEADVDADTESEEAEPFSFAEADLEDAPAGTPAAAAAPAPVVPAPAANVTAPVVNQTVIPNTSNVTFVPANNSTGFPTVPNPLDPECGCYNGATCQVKVCMCPSQWTGQWCERPSPIATARQTEMDRLANLTAVIQTVAKQVSEIEAASGSPEAVKKLIADAARKEIIQVNVGNAEREFHAALSRADLFVAREQLNLIKFMDNDKFVILDREYSVQEQRLNAQAATAAPGIAVMAVPVMQEDKYKDVDVTFAKEVRAAHFAKATDLVTAAEVQARQFNLDFGDPV
jgi:hypothetical protein